jgi:hypothetical protein
MVACVTKSEGVRSLWRLDRGQLDACHSKEAALAKQARHSSLLSERVMGVKYLIAAVVAVLAGSVLVGRASAEATTTRQAVTIPINEDDGQPCTGENMHVQGRLTTSSEVTTDASGGSHIVEGFNINATATTASGVVYRSLSQTRFALNASDGSAAVIQLTAESRLVGPGGVSFSERLLIHTTVDANGVLTAAIESSSATCN